MAANVLELTEGWTEPFACILKRSGVAQDLTGLTITAVVKDADRATVDFVGNVAVTGTLTGEVTVSPDASDFTAGNYTLRFKCLDGAGKVSYYPSRAPNRIKVRPT